MRGLLRAPVNNMTTALKLQTRERHAILRTILRWLCQLPGFRTIACHVARATIQHGPLSHSTRQRIYNLLAADTIVNGSLIISELRLPNDVRVLAELDLGHELNRLWYFWGYGGYERGLPDLLGHLFRERRYGTVIEVGANVGYYTLLLGAVTKEFNANGKVHAFEPFEPVFRQLQRNVALNATLPIVLNHVAVADFEGEAHLYTPASDNASTNASLVPGLFPQKGQATVRAIRLDEYCASHGLDQVNLVKLDCEGAEPAVLRGMGQMLFRQHPDLVIEVLPETEEELNAIFHDTAYHRYLIRPDGPCHLPRFIANLDHRDYLLTTTPLESHELGTQ